MATADWRSVIAANERKTKLALLIFFVIYFGVGFMLDIFWLINSQELSSYIAFERLIHLQDFPFMTLIMGAAALISLPVTYAMYDKIMMMGLEYHEVNESSTTLEDKQLYNIVEEMKIAASMQYMPRVFIIEREYMNAFASGYSEKSAMVAITRGLMQKLNREEIAAVMAHELTHIRHKDIKLNLSVMVTTQIVAIVLQTAYFAFGSSRSRDSGKFALVLLLLMYLFSFVSMILSMWLSRTREYMADAGAVQLQRNNIPLATALMKIHNDTMQHAQEYSAVYNKKGREGLREASYIYFPKFGGLKSGLDSLFATHPSLEDRLEAMGINPVQESDIRASFQKSAHTQDINAYPAS